MDFYAEFRKLVLSFPHPALNNYSVENCNFGDYLYRSKNIYLSYFLTNAQDCYYSDYLVNCRDCVDCSYVENSELCYECVNSSGIYNGSFLCDCHQCSDCDFCFDCLNCKDCFGCFGLRHQQFRIFNQPYSETEYRKKVAELKKYPIKKISSILQPEFNKHPRLYARQLKGGENCFGDYLYFSKNCYQCFNIRNAEDSAYISEIMAADSVTVNCMDCNFATNLNNCYECFNSHTCTNGNFLMHCTKCSDVDYCILCTNCQNCFGCIGLSHKQYCILNRQFTREEYLAGLQIIVNDLKQARSYGKSLAEILT